MSLLHPIFGLPDDDPFVELCDGLVEPDDYAGQDALIQGELADLRTVIDVHTASTEVIDANREYYELYMRTLLVRRITALNLTPRRINVLLRSPDVQVGTIQSVLNYTWKQLRSVRNFGPASLVELKKN